MTDMTESNNTTSDSKYRIQRGDIKDTNDLEQYLETKALNHTNYKFYASRNSIQRICEDHCLYLSDGSNWNDTEDGERMLQKGEYHHFGFCFSFSKSESVAMWMLYSLDDGCMIDFDAKTIKTLINPREVTIGKFGNDSRFVPIDTLNVEETGIKIQLIDMIYIGDPDVPENDEFCYVRRSEEVNRKFNRRLIGRNCLYQKSISWFYENECRLLVSVPESKLTRHDSGLLLRIGFDEKIIAHLRERKRIYNSPNIRDSADPFYKSNFNSKLSRGLNWNLKRRICGNCKKIDCQTKVSQAETG